MRPLAPRVLAGFAAVGLGVVLVAPSSHAAENPPAYEGSRVTTPSTTSDPAPMITAEIVRRYNDTVGSLTVETEVTPPAGLAEGCTTDEKPETVAKAGPQDHTAYTSAPLTVSCNGTYEFLITAEFNPTIGFGDRAEFPGEITVAAPPPPVAGVTHFVGEDRKASLSWTPAASVSPDFLGYRVERQTADGKYITVKDLPRGEKTFTDPEPIPEGGEVVYRVRGRRAAPTGEVLSESGDRVTAKVGAGSTSTTVPGTPAPGGTDGGVGGPTGGTTPSTGRGGGSRGGPRVTGRARGLTGIGVRVPSANSARADFPDLEIADEGFDEELPFDDGLAGEEPSDQDDLASLLYEEEEGRGMAVPVAIGTVMAAWAFHLRFLARAARPG
ncbi:MAG: fibronectin type III domain-containing protein [Acidimicrobiales bacterium]|nr:fibronectin type III domain-containing protein [Acidimicrobiales bacterium]